MNNIRKVETKEGENGLVEIKVETSQMQKGCKKG